MRENNITILCTRPLNENIIQKAAMQNIGIDCYSFIETNQISSSELIADIHHLAQKKYAIIFTSMNAVNAVVNHLQLIPNWDIYCISGTTKDIATNFFGEAKIKATAKNAAELATIISADHSITETIFFCGNQRLNELPEVLTSKGIRVIEKVVYTTIQTPHNIEKNYSAILFFSPSAVHSFFSVNNVHNNTIFFSIGNTTTAAIKTYSNNKIITSEWPGKDAMINLSIQYFTTLQHTT